MLLYFCGEFRKISLSIATRIWTGILSLDFQQGKEIFLLATTSRRVQEPTQSPTGWVQIILSLGLKWPGHETSLTSM